MSPTSTPKRRVDHLHTPAVKVKATAKRLEAMRQKKLDELRAKAEKSAARKAKKLLSNISGVVVVPPPSPSPAVAPLQIIPRMVESISRTERKLDALLMGLGIDPKTV